MTIRRSLGLALLPVSMALLLIGSVSGGIVLADAQSDGDTDNQAASASVATEELCTWFITNMPANATMAPAAAGTGNNSAGEDEYDGTTFDMVKTEGSDMQVYTSGNLGTGSAAANTECTFYSTKKGFKLTHTVSGTTFTATYGVSSTADAAMNFDFDSTLPLTIDGTENVCFTAADADEETSGWTLSDSSMTTGASSNDFLLLPHANTAMVNTTESSDRCDVGIEFRVTVPGGMTPSAPGETYTWSGPNIINTVTLPTS
jgi:hypothetical protein